jgi:hypothetical protein
MTLITLVIAASKTQQTLDNASAMPQIILMTLIKVRLPRICGFTLKIKKQNFN